MMVTYGKSNMVRGKHSYVQSQQYTSAGWVGVVHEVSLIQILAALVTITSADDYSVIIH